MLTSCSKSIVEAKVRVEILDMLYTKARRR